MWSILARSQGHPIGVWFLVEYCILGSGIFLCWRDEVLCGTLATPGLKVWQRSCLSCVLRFRQPRFVPTLRCAALSADLPSSSSLAQLRLGPRCFLCFVVAAAGCSPASVVGVARVRFRFRRRVTSLQRALRQRKASHGSCDRGFAATSRRTLTTRRQVLEDMC